MTKKQQIKQAKILLAQWEAIQEDQRNYEGENWHCVDVKRYDDQVDIIELVKKYPARYRTALKDHFDDDYLRSSYNLWLEDQWLILNECMPEDEDLGFIRSDYQWINHFNYLILSLGRSGGWACFQTTQEDINNSLHEIATEQTADWCYTDDTNADIEQVLEDARQIIHEVNKVKNYITEFNNGLNFEDEVIYRIEELILELKENEKIERAKKKEIKQAIKTLIDNNVTIKDIKQI